MAVPDERGLTMVEPVPVPVGTALQVPFVQHMAATIHVLLLQDDSVHLYLETEVCQPACPCMYETLKPSACWLATMRAPGYKVQLVAQMPYRHEWRRSVLMTVHAYELSSPRLRTSGSAGGAKSTETS